MRTIELIDPEDKASGLSGLGAYLPFLLLLELGARSYELGASLNLIHTLISYKFSYSYLESFFILLFLFFFL